MVFDPKQYGKESTTGKDRKPWFPELNEMKETRVSLYIVVVGSLLGTWLSWCYVPLGTALLVFVWGYYISVLVSVRLKWHHVKLMEETRQGLQEIKDELYRKKLDLAQRNIDWIETETDENEQ